MFSFNFKIFFNSKTLLFIILFIFIVFLTQSNAGGLNVFSGLYLRYEVTVREDGEDDFVTWDVARRVKKVFGRQPPILFLVSFVNVTTGSFMGSGVGGADRIIVDVEVLDVGSGTYVVNYTVMFFNISLFCYFCDGIPELLGVEPQKSDKMDKIKVWSSRELRLTKLLMVNASNNEVFNQQTGESLGEWIFWLHPNDLARNATFVLGKLGYTATLQLDEGVYYIASLVYVNFNYSDSSDYVVGGVRVERGRTVVGLSHPGLWSMRLYGIPYRDVHYLVDKWSFFGCRGVDYGNRTVEIDCSAPLEAFASNASHKPWRLTKLAFKSEKELTFFGAIEVKGAKHAFGVTNSFRMVFERRTGILLNVTCAAGKCFAPAPLSDYLSERGIAVDFQLLPGFKMVLVDTNLLLEVPSLGGSGRVNERLHAVVVAATAVAALLLALARWRR